MRRGQWTELTSFYLQTTCQSSQSKSDGSHERFDGWPNNTQCGQDKEQILSMTQTWIHQLSLISDEKKNPEFPEIMFQQLNASEP